MKCKVHICFTVMQLKKLMAFGSIIKVNVRRLHGSSTGTLLLSAAYPHVETGFMIRQ